MSIVCDRCGDIGAVGAAPQELRAGLTGWLWRNGLDICPLCRLVVPDGIRERGANRERKGGYGDDPPAP